MSPSVRECQKKQCPDLGEIEFPPGSNHYRKVCTPAGNRIPGNIVCPKEIHPLNCDTCKKTCEECIQKYNQGSKIRGCASHTDAIQQILTSADLDAIFGEIDKRQLIGHPIEVKEGQQCEIRVNNETIIYTNHMSHSLILVINVGD